MKIIPIFLLLLPFLVSCLSAEDSGAKVIGKMRVQLIHGTDGEPVGTGKEVDELQIKELRLLKEAGFSHYRMLGQDEPEILGAYESWATPLLPSKEILLSFKPLKRDGANKVQLVLDYWQSQQKVFSTNPTLTEGKTFYIVGPTWRKGRLIVALTVLELTSP